MRIILHPRHEATRADLLELAAVAHYALANGLPDKPAGETMCVTRGEDYRNTFGVVRTKSGISVWPPATPDPSAPGARGGLGHE